MKEKLFKIFIYIFFLFVILVFFVGLNKDSIYDTKAITGQKLTEIKLTNFNERTFLTDKDLINSNFTLINFWASWCKPCRDEHFFLLKLSKEKNLKLLGVNFKDKKKNAINFLNELGNPYDIMAKDELGKHSINFGIYGVPESILIDKNLVVMKKFIGPLSEKDFNYIKQIIENK